MWGRQNPGVGVAGWNEPVAARYGTPAGNRAADNLPCIRDTLLMPAKRRIALMLDLEWPYKRHAGVFAGTQRYAQEHGWESIVDEYAYDTLPARRTQTVPYDGIIARATKTLAERAARLNVPVVNVWFSSPVRDRLPGVFPDTTASGRLRAEHLLSRGFCNFAGLGFGGDHALDLETKEFCRVLQEAGYGCTTAQIPLTFASTLTQWRKTEHAIASWMDSWQLPIGVHVSGESIGRMVVQMCHERGWRVPEDVAMIAGMNEETYCENPRPSLSSVEPGYERIGYEAAQLLDRLMKAKGKRAERQHILVPPDGMVLRESTDFFAVDDEVVTAALEFIATRSHLPISPDDVARSVTTATRTLQRRFRKHLNRTIVSEIRRVRIERAKRELAQSDRPLGDVAREVGFGEPMRMYEVFRRELDVTPSDYRKQRKMGNGD